MKIKLTLLLAAMSLSFNTYSCGSYPVVYVKYKDGVNIGLFITPNDMKNSPNWDVSGNDEPPIGVVQSKKIAIDFVKKKHQEFDDVRIKNIKLNMADCTNGISGWYYLYTINPVIDGNELWGKGNWIAVLMDGSVIEPREYQAK